MPSMTFRAINNPVDSVSNIKLPFSFKDAVLATGSELKSSFAILFGDTVFISKAFDDLKNPKIFEDFKRLVASEERKLGVKPTVIACDLHPEFVSTKYAKEIFGRAEKQKRDIYIFEVQHHHAHIASCMAENGLRNKVIGVAFDGTGYGADGNIWGGEFLLADYLGFERAAHIENMPMPGADKAVEEPARMAFSYLYKVYKRYIGNLKLDVLKRIGKDRYSLFAEMIDKNINSPFTSSAGRLFDAVSSLVGLRDSVMSEGEAAIALEKIAGYDCDSVYKFKLKTENEGIIVVFKPTIRAIVSDLKNKKPPGLISRKFHNTLAEAIKRTCSVIRRKRGLNKVVLSGGVFQNSVLLREARKRLLNDGFLVYVHFKTSCADRSLSLGQAVIAAHKMCNGNRK